MKRSLLFLLTVICCTSLLFGCGRTDAAPAFFESYLLGSTDRDAFMESDLALGKRLLESDALFAYRVTKTEKHTVQVVYVWDNLLRRELRLDLMKLYDAIPDRDQEITLSMGETIGIGMKELAFTPCSSLSDTVFRAIFPSESKVNAKTLRNALRQMIIRLETLEAFGDTEVIALQTLTEGSLTLAEKETGEVQLVFAMDDVRSLNPTE